MAHSGTEPPDVAGAGLPLICSYAPVTPDRYVTPGVDGLPHIMMQPFCRTIIVPITTAVKLTRVMAARILRTCEVPSALINEPEGYQSIEQTTHWHMRIRNAALFVACHGTGIRSAIIYVFDFGQAVADSTRINIVSMSD